MELSIIILLLIILAYIVGDRAFRIRRKPLSKNLPSAYGLEFIIIGIILGPYFLNVISADVMEQIDPLVNIAFGWIGLLFGLQFRLRDLKLLPFSNYYIAGAESVFTIAISFVLISLILLSFKDYIDLGKDVFTPSIILASIAAISSSAAITGIVKGFKIHGKSSRLIIRTAGLNNFTGIAAIGIAYPFFHITKQTGDFLIPSWGWILISISIGLMLGVLFHFFITPKSSSNENLMIAVGMVALSSGISAFFHLPALFINMIDGVVLCNFSERQDRFYRLLVSAEKPLYGIILIIASAIWQITPQMLIILFIFMTARAFAKTLGGRLALIRYPQAVKSPWNFGPALFSQGGMAIAMALNYYFLVPGEMSAVFTAVVITASTLNSVVSHFTVRRFLKLEERLA